MADHPQAHQISCRHIAIIMDGNGRWAKQRHLPRFVGHKTGAKAVRNTVIAAIKHKVQALTLYAFSTENWKRPEEEVSFLMNLLYKTIENEFTELVEQGVRLSFIGNYQVLPQNLVAKINQISEASRQNTQLHLMIALNYGGQQEIVDAAQALSKQVLAGTLTTDEINTDQFAKHLALNDAPPVDLLIRTSGEMRISNFLLWQLAYTEFYFTPILWPDFNEAALVSALTEFSSRQRRYGGI